MMTLLVSVSGWAKLSTGKRMPSSQLSRCVSLLVGLQECQLVTAWGTRQVM